MQTKQREVTIQTPNGKVRLVRLSYQETPDSPVGVCVEAHFNDDPHKKLYAGHHILTLSVTRGKDDAVISSNGFSLHRDSLKKGGDLILSLPIVLGAAFGLLESED